MSSVQPGDVDPIYRGFMERQLAEGLALAEASDLVRLHFPACRRGNRRRPRRGFTLPQSSRTRLRRSSGTIPGIQTPAQMVMSRFRTLIRSQRWWT